MRHALAGCIILAISGSTHATASDDCYETAKLYGWMMRASLLCNFPERPALGQLEKVHLSPEAEAYSAKNDSKVLLQPSPEAIDDFNKSHAKKVELHLTC